MTPLDTDDGGGSPIVSETTDLSWESEGPPVRVPVASTPAAGTPGVPMLHLDGFDGPMDLLLDLVERQRIDLGQMSILALVEQFLAAFDQLRDRVAIERRADWLVMGNHPPGHALRAGVRLLRTFLRTHLRTFLRTGHDRDSDIDWTGATAALEGG